MLWFIITIKSIKSYLGLFNFWIFNLLIRKLDIGVNLQNTGLHIYYRKQIM